MKNIVIVLFLLLSFSNFSVAQSEKDTLSKKQQLEVQEKLDFMFYLHNLANKRFTLNNKEALEYDRIFPEFYSNNILANNPFTDLNINTYLGYENDETPKNWSDFSARTYQKNYESLLDLISKYGYPSKSRLESNCEKCISPITFALNIPKKEKKQLLKILKAEYKLDRITKNNYLNAKYTLSDNNLLDETNLKNQEKLTKQKIILVKEN